MTKPRNLTLIGGKVLSPTGSVDAAELHITDGEISAVAAPDAHKVDCTGHLVLPGIIDLHGDAFEKELFPRAGVKVPIARAMHAVDRHLLAHGITTAYHGLSVSWEPGARALTHAEQFLSQMAQWRAPLIADHRIQLRWEVLAHAAVPLIEQWISQDPPPALAFNDHATETLDLIKARDEDQIEKWAARVGVNPKEYGEAVQAVAANNPQKDAMVARVAHMARKAGVPMLAHDENTAAERARNRSMGLAISEFPVTTDALQAASGDPVVMGAPNALRGASHKANVSAYEAILDGNCTVLASDYHYPSMLAAVEKLLKAGDMSVGQAWSLVSENPAKAMGLVDRGNLGLGKRADVVVIDTSGDWRVIHIAAGGALTSFAS